MPNSSAAPQRAFIVTGPTSGIGHRAALELASHGAIVLVGRDREKLDRVRTEIEGGGGKAFPIVCDLSDLATVRRAAAGIVALDLPLAGLLNNAGIHQAKPTKNPQGWDVTFATDHLGPFALTEVLAPHMLDGANIVFTVSGAEDSERKPAMMAGFRGGRYISAEASARGEWKSGGSKMPGADAYATSKQANLATVLALARENPRLHFRAVEPGFNPGTSLGRESGPLLRFLLRYVLTLFAPHVRYWSTPERAGRVIARVMLDPSPATGSYYDEKGEPMLGSAQVRDPVFNARVVAETRALLATVPA